MKCFCQFREEGNVHSQRNGGKWKEKVELTKKKAITNFGGQSGTFFREMRFGKFDFSETGGMLHRLRRDGRPWSTPYPGVAYRVHGDSSRHGLYIESKSCLESVGAHTPAQYPSCVGSASE